MRRERTAKSAKEIRPMAVALRIALRIALGIAACLATTLDAPAQAPAQEKGSEKAPEKTPKTWRWRAKGGDSWRYQFRQQVQSESSGTGKPMLVKLDTTMLVMWKVAAVDPQGTAQVSQTIERFQVVIETDKLDPVRYDSAAKSAPVGAARELADRVGKLIGASCVFQLSSRGEITDLEPSAEWKQAFAGKPAPAGLELLSPTGLSQVLNQVAVLWPEEALASGAGWDARREQPALGGKLDVTTRFTYTGPADRGGVQLDRFQVAGGFAWSPLPAGDAPANPASGGEPSIKIVDGTQSGSIWFSEQLGRVVGSEMTQKLVTERPYRDLTIRVQSTSTLQVDELKPAE